MLVILRYLAARADTRPFVRAYLATGDRTPLLVLADQLDERGDPYLAAQLRAAFTAKEE